jgi:hypothetical protein
MVLPPTTGGKSHALRIRCVNNLKQIALSTRVWGDDKGDKYPWSISETNGGTMEFTAGLNAWRHFQIMSNELSTPKALLCPSDALRSVAATNFTFLNNSNLSYFVGLDASEADPQGMLFGDSNITNGTPIKNGILELTTNRPAGWSDEIHHNVGNVTLSDGSVQQLSTTGLRFGIINAGVFTNHLQMPILNP